MNALKQSLLILAAVTAVASANTPAAEAASGKAQARVAKADAKRKAKGEKGPEGRARIGALSCTVEGGVGLVLGSSKQGNCTFKGPRGTERYAGRINKVGLDLGVTGKQYLRWVVFAPGNGKSASLAGSYGGVSAQGNLGVGFGANALIGGSKDQVVLQPISLQGGTGLNVAIGVASLNLKKA